MSEEKMQTSPFECPAWFDGKKINETVFCEEFLRDYPMVTVNVRFSRSTAEYTMKTA